MNDVRIFEASHNMNQRINFANVAEEFVSQPFTLRSPLNQPSNIHILDRGRNDVRNFGNSGKRFKAAVRNRHNAEIWFNSAKWIILRGGFVRTRQRVE